MNARMLRRLFLTLALAIAGAGQAADAQQDRPVLVFAAASLRGALDEVRAAYVKPGRAVTLSYAGSSALARQIQYGAPADVFLSANSDWMDLLQRDGLIRPDSRRDLLSNRLALVAASDTDIVVSLAPGVDLRPALAGGKLAMALVEAVPAGIYGRAALTALGVWDTVAPDVAQADNVRAALMLVATGEAPLGIVYATDAAADPRVRVLDLFRANTHPPILYPAALTASAHGDAPQAFLEFLSGPKAREIFARHGFITLVPTR